MTRAETSRGLVLAMLACVVISTSALQSQERLVGLLVAPFAGPDPLSRKAATVIHLQTWQTLRMATTINGRNLSFGRGILQWTEETPPSTHAEALSLLAGSDSQMTLWGRAQEFGTGVVVQAYLSIADADGAMAANRVLWSLTPEELSDAGRTIGVGLPATLFEFGPIVLKQDVIPMLSTQVGIPVYRDRTFTQQIGALGGDFTALEQGPNMARVRASGLAEPGWVKLPGLSNNRSEVTDFAGGMLRIFRRDWSGAIDLLSRVTSSTSAPVSIRISSYQLMAAASQLLHDQIGTPNRSVEYAEAAEKLNPYLRETIKYKCMALLAVDRLPATTRKLEETVRTGGYLFPKNDPWLEKVKTVLVRRQRAGA
jgi:hypothetical protein